MATIEELEAQAQGISEAEAAAIWSILREMRECAVELPDGSKLAIQLAKTAKDLEQWAIARDAHPWGTATIDNFGREFLRENPLAEGDED